MTAIVAQFFAAADTPLVAPANAPTIRIRRTDTGALAITDSAMTELGDGAYRFDFSPTDGLHYAWRADGDPLAGGQTIVGGRYQYGDLEGDLQQLYDERGIWLDQTNGTAGTVAGVNGTRRNPVTTLADAKTLADALGFRKYLFTGPAQFHTLAATHRNWLFVGESVQRGDTIEFGTQIVDGSAFFDLSLFGTLSGVSGSVALFRCALFEPTIGFIGEAFETQIFGSIRCEGGCSFVNCRGDDLFGTPEINQQTNDRKVLLHRWSGPLQIANQTSALASVECYSIGGKVTIKNTNTAGSIRIAGVTDVVDEGATATLDLDDAMKPIDLHLMRAFRDRHVLDGGPSAADPTKPDLDPAGLILVGRLRLFRTAAEAAAATLGAANGADGELAVIDVSANNTGVAGHLQDLRMTGP